MEDKKPAAIAAKTKVIGTMKKIGTQNWSWLLANQAAATLSLCWDSTECDLQRQAIFDGLGGIDPRDELEGMMGAHLIGAHNAIMDRLRRAANPNLSPEDQHQELNQANKLLRTFPILVDAFDRHRGFGRQKAAVEHMHLHVGAQALVGVVGPDQDPSPRNGEDQHDAKRIDHAPQQALRSPNKERQAMPVAGDAERPMSAARREIDGSSEG